MIDKLCISMLKDLDNYKRSKNELLQLYVESRLAKSLINYYLDLDNSVEYLSRRSKPNKILGKINK